MKKRSKVLIFIDWFYPAYKAGGPVKSVFNLAQALQNDFDFYIVTSNADLDGEQLDVSHNEWTTFEGISLIYLSAEKQNKETYLELFDSIQPAVVYYNSLFSKKFTLLPYRTFKKHKIPQLIAPRGMLGEGALAIKALKKKTFLKLSKTFLFNDKNTYWHATSALEAEEIQLAYGEKVKVKIAQNLSSPLVPRMAYKKEKGELRMVFTSRISEKKNLLFVLNFLQSMPKAKKMFLDIYGPIEDESYWQQCVGIIDKDERIKYKGVLSPEEIAATLQQYHFYILPTLHENYGHSIVEALVAGVPVVISQHTPWRGLAQKNIGADIALNTTADWQAYLEKALQMEQGEYEAMVKSCYAFAKAHIVNTKHLEEARELFLFEN